MKGIPNSRKLGINLTVTNEDADGIAKVAQHLNC
jgi:hypothetical protein